MEHRYRVLAACFLVEVLHGTGSSECESCSTPGEKRLRPDWIAFGNWEIWEESWPIWTSGSVVRNILLNSLSRSRGSSTYLFSLFYYWRFILCEEVNRVWKLLLGDKSTVSTTALGNYFIGPFPGAWRFASVQWGSYWQTSTRFITTSRRGADETIPRRP